MSNDDYEYIDESEMPKGNRGRPSNVDPKLVEMLRNIPKGRGITIKVFAFANPSDVDAYKKHKANRNATIRSAAEKAGIKVSTIWDNGVPFVRVLHKLK